MSSSISAAVALPVVSHLSPSLISPAQFREIHKNTWLKRLTSDGKKVITVGPKKSERSWVVFCVHDDNKALLEGYAEPRQSAQHNPEWIISMQDTLHISHAIPNSNEFEFVVTLSNEVVRFHAISWETMQEWVDTLRTKLREMKILSPRENIYTKLPEVRPPLLPTRDPTSPLPAPPPVPAALVPGIERVVPHIAQTQANTTTTTSLESNSNETTARLSSTTTTTTTTTTTCALTTTTSSSNTNVNAQNISTNTPIVAALNNPTTTTALSLTSMSNMLTQNLLNMLSDPISTYSEQINFETERSADNIETAFFANISSDFDDVEDNNIVDDDDDDHDDDDDDYNEDNEDDEEGENDDKTLTEPLLRKQDKSVRVDIRSEKRSSADQIQIFDNLLNCERLIPRAQTSRSLSAGAADKSKKNHSKQTQSNEGVSHSLKAARNNNITELEICSDLTSIPVINKQTTALPSSISVNNSHELFADDSTSNITIIQVSTMNENKNDNEPPELPKKNMTGEIFKFPDAHTPTIVKTKIKPQHEYKSNVQIIPSNSNNVNSSTIQVLGQQQINVASNVVNKYSTPVKNKPQINPVVKDLNVNSLTKTITANTQSDNPQITTVHVVGELNPTISTTALSIYGTCYTPPATMSTQSTPKLPKKIILSANTSGITNITVNNTTTPLVAGSLVKNNAGFDNDIKQNVGSVHYEKVFLFSTSPITMQGNSIPVNDLITPVPKSPKTTTTPWHTTRQQGIVSNTSKVTSQPINNAPNSMPTSPLPVPTVQPKSYTSTPITTTPMNVSNNRDKPISQTLASSPLLQRCSESPTRVLEQIQNISIEQQMQDAQQVPQPKRLVLLTRGLTEAVITTRPSRKDFHFLKLTAAKTRSLLIGTNTKGNASTTTTNNNEETPSTSQPLHSAVTLTSFETQEQRRRSSSTSDAQVAQRVSRSTNNNEQQNGRNFASNNSGALRFQQPPQPFRSVENGISCLGNNGITPQTTTAQSPAAKRLTLREQQVMQLRREIMHPGGVKLQLRRKDCIGSIAWVDAFGAVWVAGWKQKEHPVLYNALHIGDQLLSIAGVTITTAAEANKIIRNANTLFVEVLIRRLPFGRGYAIRREREGQCLGLIRDGNTSTIVDVVPNSLAARHGLPPKAQSCDGTTLTFWVLTEINGRPLNLFFKENEIRDRLNSVGRDISILVQPSDLITKLKKQLKSLRGYKDYLLQ